MERKTPLYDCHVTSGGKIVPFAGYLLPVQYSGVIEEHMAVRENAGLFDVSHMGEFIISGPDALLNINRLFTNDFTNMANGRVRYGLMCNGEGGIIDDLLVYRMEALKYLVVVNAANREKDVKWMKSHLIGEAKLEDISDSLAQMALQGPKSKDILLKLTTKADIPHKYYTFLENCEVAGIKCIISQTGYTGEHGYELYCQADDAVTLWNTLLKAGKEEGLIPCGLGSRDTLRLEAAMPLYGHEMTEDLSPVEVGLSFAVKMAKVDFIGKKGIEARGEPKIARIGLKATGRGIMREHNDVYIGDEKIGATTSGTHLPYLRGAYAMAVVDKEKSSVGDRVEVDVRGRRVPAEIVPLPFYKRIK